MSSLHSSSETRFFHAAGIVMSALVAGVNLTISVAVVPAISLPCIPASVSLVQWSSIVTGGRAYAAPATLIAATAYVTVLVRAVRSNNSQPFGTPNLDLVCGAITANLGTVLYTWITMKPGIYRRLDDLLRASARGGNQGLVLEARIKQELRCWGRLNLFRSIFPLVGTVLGIYALR